MAERLLAWYDASARVLPWRSDPSPYHVWVSEIMLQQTQVQTVIPYYTRFMETIPTVADLAAYPEDGLLKLWEGLGYYSRARHLKKAAQQVMEDFDGELPDTYNALLTLSGIGPYTAGAVASIAFGERVAAVDGNVLRIISRLLALDLPINLPKAKQIITERVQNLVPAHRPGDFNQALMDLGAIVCLANRRPLCDRCPLADLCLAHMKGLTDQLPIREKRPERRVEARTVLIYLWDHLVYLEKRPPSGLLAGLWEFPTLDGAQSAEEVSHHLKEIGFSTFQIISLGDAHHLFTHLRWNMTGYLVILKSLPSYNLLSGGQWVHREALVTSSPLPSALGYYRNKLLARSDF